MTQKYEKPTMEFVSLRNEESVAATCWGNHGKGTEYFCDLDGKGYVSFQIGSGGCELNLVNVMYYANHDSEGERIYDGNVYYEELERKLQQGGGSEGNPYKGLGEVVFPDNPEPEWS